MKARPGMTFAWVAAVAILFPSFDPDSRNEAPYILSHP